MTASSAKQKNQTVKEVETEVLYQKLGEQWFAFSLIEDEVFMAPVPETEIAKIRKDYEQT